MIVRSSVTGSYVTKRDVVLGAMGGRGAAAFSPTSIPGLSLWIDLSDRSTLFTDAAMTTPVVANDDLIGAAMDKSGNLRHATTPTSGQRPKYKTNIQNGKSGALFDRSDDRLITPAFALAQPNTSIFVFRRTTGIGDGALLDGVTTRQQTWITGTPYYLHNYAGTTMVGGLPLKPDKAIVADTVFKGATSRSFIDGIFNENASRGTPGTNGISGGVQVGWSNTIPFGGYYMELIMYNSELSDSDLAKVRAYLMAKWGIAPTYPTIRYTGNPIISHQAGTYKDNQVMEPCIMVDPKDSTKLLMYFSGCPTAGGGGIARATASASSPLVWTEYGSNPLFSATPATWEAGGTLRLGSVVYNPDDDTFYLYYSAGPFPKIGLATSPGNDGINFTKYAGNPILSFTAPDTTCGLPAVLKEGSNWYLYYVATEAAVHNKNIKVCTSSDGIAWTDPNTAVWTISGVEGDYDKSILEWHQIVKLNGKYTLVTEVNDGARWRIGLAQSATPTGAFTKLAEPILKASGIVNAYDQEHVATAAIYYLNNKWYIFFVGSKSYGLPYSNPWDMGVAELGFDPSTL